MSSFNFLKKIRHIIDSKVSAYIFKRYPMFIKYLHRFTEFLDEESTIEALNFDNNNNPDTMFERYLDESWNQYCVELIDRNEFGIDVTTKRLFLSLSKLLYQNKGKPYSFDVILKYLTSFSLNGGADVTNGVNYILSENESYWHSSNSVYHIGIVPYDKPYTYRIELREEDAKKIQLLIEQYTPMGFWMLWVFIVSFDETIDLSNSSDVLIQNIHSHFNEIQDLTAMTEDLKVNIDNHFNEVFQAVNLYDGTVTYNGSINYGAIRGYAVEEATITYHISGSSDIVEVM